MDNDIYAILVTCIRSFYKVNSYSKNPKTVKLEDDIIEILKHVFNVVTKQIVLRVTY